MASKDVAPSKLAIVLHSGDYERLHDAFSIALAAVANDFDVYIFAGYDALKKLTKAEVDSIPADSAFTRPLRKIIQLAKGEGKLHLYACGSSMATLGIDRSELIEEIDEVLGLSAFLTFAEGSAFSFFV